VAQHLVGSLAAHQQEVCGLKWSPDGKYLASGGNDNLLNVWPVDPGMFYTSAAPVYTFSQHQAAVKASFVLLNCSAQSDFTTDIVYRSIAFFDWCYQLMLSTYLHMYFDKATDVDSVI